MKNNLYKQESTTFPSVHEGKIIRFFYDFIQAPFGKELEEAYLRRLLVSLTFLIQDARFPLRGKKFLKQFISERIELF